VRNRARAGIAFSSRPPTKESPREGCDLRVQSREKTASNESVGRIFVPLPHECGSWASSAALTTDRLAEPPRVCLAEHSLPRIDTRREELEWFVLFN